MAKKKKKKKKIHAKNNFINANSKYNGNVNIEKTKNEDDLINLYVFCSIGIIFIYGICTSFSTIYQLIIS
ncbi:hypothetical protein [Clostridioides difficile]|uniref:hypothetical protein n=1 Tax=Clostridioides difficile TaxID=1496 RepID=UPI0013EF8132|nr:hypothetical protein [Clostridioides difficile]MDM9944020.1 hypothetical protein [Clostridioides difficile]